MISPQGYSLGEEPKSTNPFWGSGEDGDVNMIFASASVQGETGDGPANVQTNKTIDGHNITFGFLFKNIIGKKGDKGDPGTPGAPGEPGAPGTPGAPGADGTTPVITITATQDGQPVTVTKTGTDAAPNFEFALTGGGGSTGDLVGWGPELASTVNYPAIKNTKKAASEAFSETGIQLSGALNDDQWQSIYISGTCDVSIDADTVFNINSSVKMAENDNTSFINWSAASGFEFENISITDNAGVWTLSDVKAEVQYVSDTGIFVTGLSIKITCTATSGAVTKSVNGNVSISFNSNIGYTTATTYQNLVVVGQ